MRRADQRDDFRCPADLFPGHQGRIADLTAEINQAPTARDLAGPAATLADEMDALLACGAYEQTSMDCRLCRGLAELRSKTAALVGRAGALDERRR